MSRKKSRYLVRYRCIRCGFTWQQREMKDNPGEVSTLCKECSGRIKKPLGEVHFRQRLRFKQRSVVNRSDELSISSKEYLTALSHQSQLSRLHRGMKCSKITHMAAMWQSNALPGVENLRANLRADGARLRCAGRDSLLTYVEVSKSII